MRQECPSSNDTSNMRQAHRRECLSPRRLTPCRRQRSIGVTRVVPRQRDETADQGPHCGTPLCAQSERRHAGSALRLFNFDGLGAGRAFRAGRETRRDRRGAHRWRDPVNRFRVLFPDRPQSSWRPCSTPTSAASSFASFSTRANGMILHGSATSRTTFESSIPGHSCT